MTGLIKICGLTTPETLDAALDAGADMVGFVRFARSPRHLSLDRARDLAAAASGRALRVLLMVDPADGAFDEAVAAIVPDLVQLHGHESPDRVAALKGRAGRPIIKALGIASVADLATVEEYRGAADRILFDAKPPPESKLPGGNGVPFAWRLLADAQLEQNDMVSGGLSPTNVADAIFVSGCCGVDVSSGVESRPGRKDPARIRAFVRAARTAFADAARRAKEQP